MAASTSDSMFRGCLCASEALAVAGAANLDFLFSYLRVRAARFARIFVLESEQIY